MTEVLSIFFQLFIFLVIFSFPLTPKILNNNFSQKEKFNFIDTHSINIIFFIYICLIASFLNFDLKLFFKIYFLLSLIWRIIGKVQILPSINKLFSKILVTFSLFMKPLICEYVPRAICWASNRQFSSTTNYNGMRARFQVLAVLADFC